MSTISADVVVVGAGLVGLVAASERARSYIGAVTTLDDTTTVADYFAGIAS